MWERKDKEKQAKQSTAGAESNENETNQATRDKGVTHGRTKHAGKPYRLRGREHGTMCGYG